MDHFRLLPPDDVIDSLVGHKSSYETSNVDSWDGKTIRNLLNQWDRSAQSGRWNVLSSEVVNEEAGDKVQAYRECVGSVKGNWESFWLLHLADDVEVGDVTREGDYDRIKGETDGGPRPFRSLSRDD